LQQAEERSARHGRVLAPGRVQNRPGHTTPSRPRPAAMAMTISGLTAVRTNATVATAGRTDAARPWSAARRMVRALAKTSPTVTGASPRWIAICHFVPRSRSQARQAAYMRAQLGSSIATVATRAPVTPEAANPIRLTMSELGPGAAWA